MLLNYNVPVAEGRDCTCAAGSFLGVNTAA